MALPGKKGFISFIVILFFSGLIYGEYRFSNAVIQSKRELDSLRRTRMVLERSVEQKTKRVSVYKKAIADLKQY